MRSVVKVLMVKPAGTSSRGLDGTGIILASLSADGVVKGGGRSDTVMRIGLGINVTLVPFVREL